jgi:uncharacterized protein YndB with AHSA1/START domain
LDEGTVAVIGFFLCILVAILRKPVSKLIESSRIDNADVVKLENRCQKLEQSISDVSGELIRVAKELDDIKSSSDFSYKLLQQQQANLVAISARAQADRAIDRTDDKKKDAPRAEDFGKVTNEHTIRFERLLDGTKEEVWRYFTESDRLSQWLAEGKIETQFGGRVELDFALGRNPGNPEAKTRVKGLVSRAEENKALCFSWEDETGGVSSLLSIELFEDAEKGKTRIVLTHSRLPQERMHHFMACWHTFLDTLSARLKNVLPPDFNTRLRDVIQVYLILVVTVMAASPALADTPASDYRIVSSERTRLLAKYDNLWHDVDKTQREMDALKRERTADADQNLDYLDKQLKNKYRDIKEVEYEIKDLDLAKN